MEEHQNATDDDFAKDIIALRYVIFILYGFICLLGIFGNMLVVYVVIRKKVMQTITNIFITNLAISDILMSVVAVPFTPFSLYVSDWTLPRTLCKFLPITMGVSVYVSTLTSTAIAVDRYFNIVYPFIPRMKKALCYFIISSVWIIAVMISLPLSVYQEKDFDMAKNVSRCHENWPSESREVFTMVSFFLQFIIPCIIISVCYRKVSNVLLQRCVTKIGSGAVNRHREEIEIKRKYKTNKMLIAMVTIFVICWIPINIHWITTDMLKKNEINIKKLPFFTLIFLICHILAMSSAVYNPFIYTWMNENFKKEFRAVLPCVFKDNMDNYNNATDLKQTRLIDGLTTLIKE